METVIRNASLADIPIIQDIAERTWWPTYQSILSAEQCRFMLNAIYSRQALEEEIVMGNQQFLILQDEKLPQGFASYGVKSVKPNAFKLHKIYVLPEGQGKGYGKLLIEEIVYRIKAVAKTLDLNVNRHNSARQFYEKIGFTVSHEEDVPVGPYFMNDYVMRLQVDQYPITKR